MDNQIYFKSITTYTSQNPTVGTISTPSQTVKQGQQTTCKILLYGQNLDSKKSKGVSMRVDRS